MKKESNQSAFTCLYHKYKTNAKSTKRLFELTKDQFKNLTSSRCSYCGILPYQLFNPFDHYKGKPISRKPYVYNGVDRVDPKKGYIISNCVPCCGTCNRMKRDLDLDTFLKKIKMIYQHSLGG